MVWNSKELVLRFEIKVKTPEETQWLFSSVYPKRVTLKAPRKRMYLPNRERKEVEWYIRRSVRQNWRGWELVETRTSVRREAEGKVWNI